jgi:hypothetical protein
MAMFLGEEVQNSCRYFFIDRAAGMFDYLGIGHFETEDHSISSSFLIIGIWKALMIVDYEFTKAIEFSSDKIWETCWKVIWKFTHDMANKMQPWQIMKDNLNFILYL